ncbi:adipose-secreted signaling protein [Rhynochetos jubatus]
MALACRRPPDGIPRRADWGARRSPGRTGRGSGPAGWPPAPPAPEGSRRDESCGDTWPARAARRRGGGVRFAPSQPSEGGHVRFAEKLHDSAVTVTQEKDGSFLVKVGFLKIQHKYEITFLLPPALGEDVRAAPSLPSLNLRVIGVTPLPEGCRVTCEYTAQREGVLREEVLLGSGGGAGPRVVVQARVMDRHHGTPMLLDGVRCVGAEPEYDSEQSDWHGFD